MINKELKETKFQPLIDKINEIDKKYGSDLSENLMHRLDLKISQFLKDFEMKSKKSFEIYWDRQLYLKNKNTSIENKDAGIDIVPEFIKDFENKNKK